MSLSLWGSPSDLLDPLLFDSPALRLLERRSIDPSLSRISTWQPRTDISETEKEYKISVEIPGAKKDDLTVELVGNNQLQISGKVEQEKKEKDEVHYRYERVFGSFQRSFTLPEDANPETIKGDYNNGVLKVLVQKRPKEKRASSSKRIELS